MCVYLSMKSMYENRTPLWNKISSDDFFALIHKYNTLLGYAKRRIYAPLTHSQPVCSLWKIIFQAMKAIKWKDPIYMARANFGRITLISIPCLIWWNQQHSCDEVHFGYKLLLTNQKMNFFHRFCRLRVIFSPSHRIYSNGIGLAEQDSAFDVNSCNSSINTLELSWVKFEQKWWKIQLRSCDILHIIEELCRLEKVVVKR